MILMRFVQGQFDLFWVAAQVSIPFVIAGVCLGAQAYAARSGAGEDGLPRAVPGSAEAAPPRAPGPADSPAGRHARRPRARRLPLPVGHRGRS
jgi:hypothetical protein